MHATRMRWGTWGRRISLGLVIEVGMGWFELLCLGKLKTGAHLWVR